MSEFHHHPDDVVIVRAGDLRYQAEPTAFAGDAAACGLPVYGGLPAGFRERRYVAGGLHTLYTADTQVAGGEWPDGAAYVAACAELIAAAGRRRAAANPAVPS